MFSFYGRKWGKIKKYPSPRPNLTNLIDPFCGSASWPLYWDNPMKHLPFHPYKYNVTIIDIDEIIISVWKYLRATSRERILQLPIIPRGETLDNYPYLCQEEKWLIGFCINNGSAQPKLKASTTGNFYSWHRDRIFIADNVDRIRDWKIMWGDYTRAPDIEANWFIDPPYKGQGKYYRYNKIDYSELADWCKSRKGQVIVCEMEGADWLPFKPLYENSGQRRKTKEVIWTNN